METGERKSALIVGASSGIGAALASALAGEGYHLALVARRATLLTEVAEGIRKDYPDLQVETYAKDVRAFDEVELLLERIVGDFHGLDLIAYAAGIMPPVELDEYDLAKDREIVDVNLTGAMAWLNPAAKFLSLARAGTIVGISSIAGERGRRGNPAYCASKAGLNAYLEALRNRLAPFGVHVMTVKPGFVQTAMLEGRSGTFWVISPEEAAQGILKALRGRKQTVFVSARWALVAAIVRWLPSVIFRRLKI
jgi:short-subunit dehydrogenase